jgi:hypothetical protein
LIQSHAGAKARGERIIELAIRVAIGIVLREQGGGDQRNANVGRRLHFKAVEPPGHDADDGEGPIFEREGLADDVRVAVELALPIWITQHHGWRGGICKSVGGCQNAAIKRLHAERGEEIAGDHLHSHAIRAAGISHSGIVVGISDDLREAGGLALQRFQRAVRVIASRAQILYHLHQAHQALGIPDRERAQQQRVHQQEDRAVQTDAEGQRGDDVEREDRRFSDQPQGVKEIAKEDRHCATIMYR